MPGPVRFQIADLMMVTGRPRRRLFEALGSICVLLCFACDVAESPTGGIDRATTDTLPTELHQKLVQNLTLESLDLAHVEEASGQRLLLPIDHPFRMTAPTSVDVVGEPICQIVVSDSRDDALHFFGIDGDYRSTLRGGASDTSVTMNIRSVDILPSGMIGVTSAAHEEVALFRVGGDILRRQSVSPDFFEDQFVASGGDIALVDSALVVDHWFRRWLISQQHIDWTDPSIPLLRVWSPDGYTRAGDLLDYPGLFRPTLSRGRLSVVEDTVWFGRSIDAVLLKFVRDGTGSRLEVVDSLQLPVFFEMRPPMQALRDGESDVARAEYHLIDFEATADGFWVLQALSYPDPAEVRTVDRWRTTTAAIVRYSREGRREKALGIRGDVRQMAVAASRAAVIIRRSRGDPWEIRVIDLSAVSREESSCA